MEEGPATQSAKGGTELGDIPEEKIPKRRSGIPLTTKEAAEDDGRCSIEKENGLVEKAVRVELFRRHPFASDASEFLQFRTDHFEHLAFVRALALIAKFC